MMLSGGDMHRLLIAASLGLGLVGLSAGAAPVYARGDAADDVKAADAGVYQAIASRDGGRLADLLDDGFTLTNTFGEVYDKQKFLAACCTADSASTSKPMLLGATELQVKTWGNAAVVVARTEMRFTRDNQEQKLAWRSTRTYVRAGSKWKLAAEQRTTIG
jgi:ketosteroid isomerase-like protein